MISAERLTCINCPFGCLLEVEVENGKVGAVRGNRCAKGIAYAREEIANPVRVLTTTIPIAGAAVAAAPVKSSLPVPKNKLAACISVLQQYSLNAPVHRGQVVVHNILGTQADIVLTRSLAKTE